MRALSVRIAIVLATVVAIAGCRSGGRTPWGRQKTEGAMSNAQSGPELPSASATPPAYGSSYNTAATAPQGASPFAEPAGAAPYPGQPAGYQNAPAAPGADYGGTPGAPPVNYAADPSVPQQGPYLETNTPPQAGPAQPYTASGYPTTATPVGYQPGQPTAAPSAAPDPYANAGGYGNPSAAQGAPVENYGAAPPAGNSYGDTAGGYPTGAAGAAGNRTADSRYGAADPYATPSQPAAGQPPAANSTSSEPYRPGSTGYKPGQTGYSPPGVPQYQVPAQPNVPSIQRSNPYYRPGSTSDYVPAGGSGTPSASASSDRYNTPAIGYGQADPYAQ